MRHILFLLSLQSIQLGSSFDLPQPLDNFYDEVVRFYKRLRQEGGKLTSSNFFALIYWQSGQYSYHHKLNPCPKLKISSKGRVLTFGQLLSAANRMLNCSWKSSNERYKYTVSNLYTLNKFNLLNNLSFSEGMHKVSSNAVFLLHKHSLIKFTT